MSVLEPLQVEVRANPNPVPSLLVPPEIIFDLDVLCPYCRVASRFIVRHGTYKRSNGAAQRYKCKRCYKTFNAAKIPAIQDLMHQVAWRLAEIVVRDGYPVNALANTLNVPETTLRRVITAIREILAVNLEVIQTMRGTQIQLLEATPFPLRVVFIDEGFIKIAGITWYLIFGVNYDGTLLFADLVNNRNALSMKACLEECEAVLGKLDVVVSDGHSATHAALRRWSYPLIHVQHIHSGSRKRVNVHEIEPVLGKKQAKVTTVSLHSDSLKPGRGTLMDVKQRTVQLPPLTSSSTSKSKKKRVTNANLSTTTKLDHILTPPVTPLPKKAKPPPSDSTNGWKFHLRTETTGNGWELTKVGDKTAVPSAPPGLMEQVLKLLEILRQVFGELSIMSNLAETFNSIHDRRLTYQGCISSVHAHRDLYAWQTVYFYPEGAQAILRAQNFHFPLSLVRVLLPWSITKVKIR